ncbi:MAG: class I SAM-dependent methyltransferase [Mycobacteriales bacterium]
MRGPEWLSLQEARKRDEARFHDADRADHADEKGQSRQENRKFYSVFDRVDGAMAKWVEHWAAGRLFLDFACGHGNQTMNAAAHGAALAVGIDISEISVRNATERAAARGLGERVRFLQRDCEATGFEANAFDAILCSGVLHHMELAKAFAELHRIVRPGGRVLAVEALGHNPVIQMYRNRTPELRTSWEKDHILRVGDLDLAREWFDVSSVRFFNLLAPLSVLLPEGPIRAAGRRVAEGVDVVLTRTPGIRLLSWVFMFELTKPAGPQ